MNGEGGVLTGVLKAGLADRISKKVIVVLFDDGKELLPEMLKLFVCKMTFKEAFLDTPTMIFAKGKNAAQAFGGGDIVGNKIVHFR